MRKKTHLLIPLLVSAVACLLPVTAAAQTKPVYLRSTCYKLQPGASGAEFEKLHADGIQKLAQYRIKQGAVLRYALSRAVLPGGEQSECDYLMSFTYPGFPPELVPENTAKFMKAGGATLPYDAYVAKSRSLVKNVATRIFLLRASAGNVPAGGYYHVNRMKIKDLQEWLKMERDLWKPVQEARVSDGQMSGWFSYTLVLPSGSGQVFDAATVDAFPSWEAQGTQKPLADYVKKAHPNMTMAQFLEPGTKARDLLVREVFKVVLEAH